MIVATKQGTRTMRTEYEANQALCPATRLQSNGWKVGANALQPVKPRKPARPVRRFSFFGFTISF